MMSSISQQLQKFLLTRVREKAKGGVRVESRKQMLAVAMSDGTPYHLAQKRLDAWVARTQAWIDEQPEPLTDEEAGKIECARQFVERVRR